MSDTSGRTGSGLSPSAVLQSSLASRLTRRFAQVGSMEFSLTSSQPATPAGRLIYRLRASARRNGDSGFTSWLSPRTPTGSGQAQRSGAAGGRHRKLEDQVFGMITEQWNGQTVLGGALAPALPCWLMGYSPAWDDCAVTAMQ